MKSIIPTILSAMDSKDIEGKKPIEPVDFETAISQTGYGKFNHLLMLTAFIGIIGSLSGSTTLSYVLPAAECDLNLTNFDKGTLNGMVYAGSMTSPIVWAYLSDNLGRQKLIVIGYIGEGLCFVASSMTQSVWFLQLFRFLAGLTGCGPSVIIFTYLAELHASQYRSRVILLTSIFVSASFIIVPALAWAILPQPWLWTLFGGAFKYRSWNVFLLVSSIPSLLSGIILMFFPESPKFLMSRGRRDEAMEVFKKIYSTNNGKNPDAYPVKNLVNELELGTGPTSVGASKMSIYCAFIAGCKQIQPLFTMKHLRMLSLLACLQGGLMIGMNILRLWVPNIFSIIQEFATNPETKMIKGASFCEMFAFNRSSVIQNYSNTDNISVEECSVYVADPQIYINSLIIGACCGMCVGAATFLINALGKKMLMIPCFFVSGVLVLGIIWSRSSELTLGLLSVHHGFLQIVVSCVIAVVVDIFPTTLRAMSLTVISMFGRFTSLVGNMLFPLLLDVNCDVAFILIGVTLFLCSAASWLLPSAKQKALE